MKIPLVDFTTLNFNTNGLLKESLSKDKGNGNLLVNNIIMATAEVKNGNGRFYPKPLWEREIDKYNREKVAIGNALNELDHPDSNIVNLKNVSHVVRKVWWDGDKIMGNIEVLSKTPSGNIMRALIESDVTIGLSTRGMGSLKQKGDLMEVQDDFDLICLCDAVSTPSNPGSWIKDSSPLNENLNFSPINPYQKVNSLLTDILCSNGTCPIF